MKTLLLTALFFISSLSFAQTKKDYQTKKDSTATVKIPLRLSLIKPDNYRPNPFSKKINYPVLAGVGVVTTAAVIAINHYYQTTWWRGKRTKFKFVNDWKYALWIDKFGHMLGTDLIAHGFSSALEAANFETLPALWLGAAGGLAMQLYVEYQDGFGPQWGFSPGDAASDFLGAVYYVGQYYYPFLKNFQLRVSYFPSKKMLEGKMKDHNISDDYEGQKLWLSVRVNNLLPPKFEKIWPDWLMLSFGYGVSELNGNGGGIKKFYLGFDFDAEELPLHGRVWNFVKNTLNYIHFPMPGIRISPNAAFLVFAY